MAFAFDLATSIVLTRQGNPDWADTEGDANNVTWAAPFVPDQYRAMDMFARLDGRMWFAPERLLIPQADEQQRFLANIILDLLGRPVPRLWYLPGSHRRLIVNTGDTCVSSPAARTTMLGDLAVHDAVRDPVPPARTDRPGRCHDRSADGAPLVTTPASTPGHPTRPTGRRGTSPPPTPPP